MGPFDRHVFPNSNVGVRISRSELQYLISEKGLFGQKVPFAERYSVLPPYRRGGEKSEWASGLAFYGTGAPVDFTGGPVADQTLRSTPERKERTPDWEWSSINLSIHPTIKNVRTTIATLNLSRSPNREQKKKARGAAIRWKNGVTTRRCR